MSSPPAEAETIAEMAADLRQDPVLVHQSFGNGRTEQVAEELGDLADDVGVPVFVALVQRPSDPLSASPSDDLLRSLHRELDEPGLYVVETAGGITEINAFGVDLDPTTISLARYAATETISRKFEEGEYLSPAGRVAMALTAAADEPDHEVSDAQIDAIAQSSVWVAVDPDEPSRWDIRDGQGESLTPLVVGVAVGVTTLVVVWRVLRARAARPALIRNSQTLPDIVELRERLDRLIADLSRRLTNGRSKGKTTTEATRGAEDRLDLARGLRDSEDVLDVIGAIVLVSDGQDLTSRRPTTYRRCFFHPLHGAARGEVRAGRGTAADTVPACTSCDRALAAGRSPEALVIQGRRGRLRPYYEGSSVWARTGFGSLVDDLPHAIATQRGGRR